MDSPSSEEQTRLGGSTACWPYTVVNVTQPKVDVFIKQFCVQDVVLVVVLIPIKVKSFPARKRQPTGD